MARVTVDQENNAEQWWEEAQAAARGATAPDITLRVGYPPPGDPVSLCDWLVGVGFEEAEIDDGDVEEFLAWATSLPGWKDGPKHAPTPLIVE